MGDNSTIINYYKKVLNEIIIINWKYSEKLFNTLLFNTNSNSLYFPTAGNKIY